MGFHLRLDDRSSQLVQLVTKNPSRAFGRVYSSYLLFLLGERDQSELNWLLESAKALDSLTGADIAYCVFAKEFKVTLKTNERRLLESHGRPRESLGSFPLDRFPDEGYVTRLVKDGKFGRVMDGDEITAVTYGTDVVARELGLIGRLPCVVVVDAVPSSSLFTLALDSDTTPKLLSILRSSIAEFQSTGGSAASQALGTRLAELQQEMDRESVRDATLRVEVATHAEKILKLERLITKPQKPGSLPYIERALDLYRKRNASISAELDDFAKTHHDRNADLAAQLKSLHREFERNAARSFSRVLERQVRSSGLERKLHAAKATSMSYFGQLFKPDFLLKVWSAVS